ncbi:MAG: FKBP-type peptidyl-prolyl cis-trans isomerase [Candidatus Promineifilaceae bacterium]|nr:FKBP-type peptidyl-prolyl cis-trans isomerase [Candidatus Promineifilaceae bacterium]
MKVRLFGVLLVAALMLAALMGCGPAPSADEVDEAGDTVVEEVDEVEEAEDEDLDIEAEEDAIEDVDDVEEDEEGGIPESFEGFDYMTTESGLNIAIVAEGSGEAAEAGDIVRVHYTGMLEDGTVFDSSDGRDPFRFMLGQGQVIPGWDEGIAMLQEGAEARLIIPPDLAYGEAGAGAAIPPNATLFFEVELIEVLEGGPQTPTEVDEDELVTTESGLMYATLEEGEGETPEPGQPVRVHLTMWTEDGTRISSTLDEGEPAIFPLREGQIFPGMLEGISTMEVGETRQLIIPPDLGFGEEGAGGLPPDTTLIMEVELLEVLEAPPATPTEVADDAFESTESGVQYAVLEEGSGGEVVAGQPVTIQFTGWISDDLSIFASSFDRGEPATFVAGAGQFIPGAEEAIVGMREGGVRQIIVPAEQAFGAQGIPGLIPPDSDLILEVEVLEVGEAGEQ